MYENCSICSTVITINRYLNTFSGPIAIFLYLLLFILSFCWSGYFIISIVNNAKKNRMNRGANMHEEMRLSLNKNQRSELVKKCFLLTICICECVFISTLVLILISSYFQGLNASSNVLQHQISLSLIYTLNSISGRLEIVTCVNVYLFLMMLIRILTQYLANQYSFYKKNISLRLKLAKILSFLLFLTVIGLFQIFVILFRVLFFTSFIWEFITYLRTSNCLCKLLYKRFFDAKFHENQGMRVVSYYRQAHQEYKITSIFLTLSLLLHMITLFIVLIHPIVVQLLVRPDSFLNIIYSDFTLHEYLPPYVDAYNCVVSSLIDLTFTFGVILLIFPYGVVSMSYVISYFIKQLKSRKYRYPGFSEADTFKPMLRTK